MVPTSMRWGMLASPLLVACMVSMGSAQAPSDAVTREVVLVLRTHESDANSREVVFRRFESSVDANSREVVFFRSTNRHDVVSRELSLNLVNDVGVPDGFLARQYAQIPSAPAEWMALAVQPSPAAGYLDLFVTAVTGQFGAPEDPPDDHLYRVRRGSLHVESVLSFETSETDPIDIVFGGGGGLGPELYVVARHLDGYAPGDSGGTILRVDGNATVSPFFSDLQLAKAPHGVAIQSPAGGGFAEALYCANGSASPYAAFSVDAGGASSFVVDHTSGFDCAAFAPGNNFGNDLFLAGAEGIVYVVDATGNATPFSAPLGVPVHAMAFSNEYGFGAWLYALLGDGNVVRLDAAAQVEPFLQGLWIEPVANDVVRNDLTFTPDGDVLYVSDARRGVVYGVQATLPTGVDARATPSRAAALLGNHPNPFNPSTTIRFRLAASQRVELAVYDVAGRLVQRLTDGEVFESGRHEIVWNGRDEAGRPVASGVYCAMLRSENVATGHKMLLLK